MWRSMRMKFVVIYLLLILFALQLIGAYFVRTLAASLIRNETDAVENQVQLFATIAAPTVANVKSNPSGTFTSILSSFPQYMNGVLYLLNSEGVVEDTSAGTALVGQKRIDSVVTQVLVSKRRSTVIRFDPIHQQHLLAVAAPMTMNHSFVGVVEYVVPIEKTYETVSQVTTIFYTGSAIVLILTCALGIVLSRTITRPILDVIRQARHMAGGDFSRRVEVLSDDEFGDLATAVNDLTGKLEDAIAANLRERERLRAIITYMGDGVIAFDAQFQPMFYNDAARELLAITKQDFHQAAALLGFTEPDATLPLQERAFIRQVGDALLHVHMTSIQRSNGLEGYVVVIRDVTEQEKLNRARRDFVANVSHELRTPLTSIRSYIEALQEDDSDPQVRRKFHGVILQETNRMVRLTRDLLQLSGLEERKEAEAEDVIDVCRWLGEIVERFQLPSRSRSVRLSLECSVTERIKGNRDMLDRVLDNILSNAFAYARESGNVKVSAAATRTTIEIRVTDTGIGIPKADLPHVFDRFYRVDKARSRRRGGTGLGLALAREITEMHGGGIEIDSELDRGTSVTISLPIYKEVDG